MLDPSALDPVQDPWVRFKIPGSGSRALDPDPEPWIQSQSPKSGSTAPEEGERHPMKGRKVSILTILPSLDVVLKGKDCLELKGKGFV